MYLPRLTFRHWSGVTPYTSSYEFAGSCVFGKQLPENLSLRPCIATGQALSLTYGRFFAEFLEDLSFVRLSLLDQITCVGLRYGRYALELRRFSWNRALYALSLRRRKLPLRLGLCIPDLPSTHPHGTNRHPIAGHTYYRPSLHRTHRRSGNINPVSIGCGFHHPLRPD
jgi:hypothetical protein